MIDALRKLAQLRLMVASWPQSWRSLSFSLESLPAVQCLVCPRYATVALLRTARTHSAFAVCVCVCVMVKYNMLSHSRESRVGVSLKRPFSFRSAPAQLPSRVLLRSAQRQRLQRVKSALRASRQGRPSEVLFSKTTLLPVVPRPQVFLYYSYSLVFIYCCSP